MKHNKTMQNLKKTHKALGNFIKSTIKNYKSMKKKIKSIWAVLLLLIIGTFASSCNVTRTITNQSEYYQRGDTSVVIQTKTVETYDATKKGL